MVLPINQPIHWKEQEMIRHLIVKGATCFDQSDAEGLAATYADDAVLTAATGEQAEGKRAILDYWVQMVRAFAIGTGEVGRSCETADSYFRRDHQRRRIEGRTTPGRLSL
jgi:ketosteroid isomerase-like protein